MTLEEIVERFTFILNDEETSISNKTKNKWMVAMQSRSKTQLMFMITQCYLAGCNLKVIK